MKSEEIILLSFVGILVIGVPLVLWFMYKENKLNEEEEKLIRKNKSK